MGRTKTCRVCNQVLYCKNCGERQTPMAPDWQQILVRVLPDTKLKLEENAKKEGIPLAKYIRQCLNLGDN